MKVDNDEKTVTILGRQVPVTAIAAQLIASFVLTLLIGGTVFGAVLTAVGVVLILAMFRDKAA